MRTKTRSTKPARGVTFNLSVPVRRSRRLHFVRAFLTALSQSRNPKVIGLLHHLHILLMPK